MLYSCLSSRKIGAVTLTGSLSCFSQLLVYLKMQFARNVSVEVNGHLREQKQDVIHINIHDDGGNSFGLGNINEAKHKEKEFKGTDYVTTL